MSMRYYCDGCGVELTGHRNFVSERLHRHLGDVHVEVMVGVVDHTVRNAVAPTWNLGHVCVACVLRTVAEGWEGEK